jgi:signal transduction histidine kinase/CheY-like chemotaxis protein
MPDTVASVHDLRVLVYAPSERESAATCDLLSREHIDCRRCLSIADTCVELKSSVGALILTEEALDDPALPQLASALKQQPAWSDVPVLLITSGDRSHTLLRTLQLFESLGNVTLLDRPIRTAAIISIVRAALRARERQYDMRGVLAALRSARDDAERANRLKDEFLATLSHELRTPLNAILGWVSMLRRTPLPYERLPYALEVIERNAKAQADLIGQILDVSRIITGRLRLHPESVDVRQLIAEAIESVQPAADAKLIAVVTHAREDLRPIHGDRERLLQVLWNLLSNAVKFTPSGGRIDIRPRHTNSEVEIAVTDTGIGLTPEFMPFAFDRFRQADQSFTRAHSGLGLGLSIVKHLVELHGGSVSVESAGSDAGTTFRVKLPVESVAKPHDHAREGTGASPAVDLHGRAILVVDDDASTRELLTEMLTRCHARVVTAPSAGDALERVARTVPSLIIADIGMPAESGLSMMARLRRLPPERGGDLPAIALSAYARAEDRIAALRAGFNEFLSKPATAEDVLRAVQQLLGSQSSPEDIRPEYPQKSAKSV